MKFNHNIALKAFLFDWDGVFNPGIKGENLPSTFSEPDAMGINMLRFSHYLAFGEVPFVGIISGEQNPVAIQLAKREHFNEVFFKYHHKVEAMAEITQKHGIDPKNCAFVFDDILDLSLAAIAGIRILISRPGDSDFNRYVSDRKLADYKTENTGATYAIREATEWLIERNGNFTQTLDERITFSEHYKKYLSLRNAIETNITIYQSK